MKASFALRRPLFRPFFPLLFGLAFCMTLLGACDRSTEHAASAAADAEADAEADAAVDTDATRSDSLHYHLDKLPDRSFTSTYGGEEHPRTWYTAAEALGEIGRPAIPPLIERLDSDDAYEVMLALYALQLASQDAVLMAETGGDYIALPEVLTERRNDENTRIARDWWARHAHRWE